ncbi:MAG: glycosyltransferase family 39 protein [Planctomycetes bacterium]|nr:glycosyltransferase family 39 protein [Planctomycetota bacterium]
MAIPTPNAAPPARPGPHGRAAVWHRATVAAIAVLALAVFTLGVLYHSRLTRSGEYDDYVGIAEALRAGHVRADHFHPLLYPLVVAAVSWLTPTVFCAGKLVSAAAFAALLLGVHRLLRRYADPAVAGAGVVAVALGPGVWLEGMRVATDMFGAALVLWAYVLAIESHGSAARARWRAALVGLLAGAAVTTRYNLGLHLPVLVVALGIRQRGLIAPLVAVGSAAVAMLPHALVRYTAHGAVFANDNWQNIVLRHAFGRDMERMRQLSEAELAALLAEHWPAWLWRGLGDFLRWLVDGLPRLQLDRAAMAWPPLVWVVLAFIASGVVAVVIRYRRDGVGWLLLGAMAQALVVTVTFDDEPRILLFSTVAFAGLALAGLARGSATGVAWPALFAAAVIALQHANAIPGSWRAFLAAHADAEVAAARALVAEHGPLIQVAGTYPFLERELECAGTAKLLTLVPNGGGPAAEAVFWDGLERIRARRPVSWFVLGRQTAPGMYGFARTATLRPGWTRVRSDDDVVVLHRAGDIELLLTAEPREWRAGTLRLGLEPRGGEAASLVWIGVELRGPAGAVRRLELPPRAGGFELALPYGELTLGDWLAVPTTLDRAGRITQGQAVPIRVRR